MKCYGDELLVRDAPLPATISRLLLYQITRNNMEQSRAVSLQQLSFLSLNRFIWSVNVSY